MQVYNEFKQSGKWLYINGVAIEFDSEEQALAFLIDLIGKEVLK